MVTKPDSIAQEESRIALIPGAEPSARIIDPWWWLVALAVALALFLVFTQADYGNILKFILPGLKITVVVTIVSYLLMLILGMLGGLGRLSKNFIFHGLASLYVEIVRGIPLLVQLIIWYFVFPSLIRSFGDKTGIDFLANYRANPDAMAIIGLTFCYGAYMSEIFRAGIQSIPKGQMEAGRSLGMSYVQSMRHIILPQAIRVMLPPVGNEFVSLLKDSSLVSVVAVADMTRRGEEYMSAHFNPLPVWLFVALIYLILTLLASRVVSWLEKRTHVER